ncbi:MAG: trehalose-6-phosphate synthase [Deltaproteobacteria bacterium HGW-Deltaproteobacteria-15]|jgi:trehalose 6-phosphate synthase|nr:MAG: trehalose-6-phosphate synthase [Deltaproteobacteria bacterium HGW-Deltaproteobacteria-15]
MDAEALGQLVSRIAEGSKFILVSNREPWLHERDTMGIKVLRPASGMVTALEPIIRATGGTWIAHGAGSADRLVTDHKDRIEVPPEKPAYVLKRVWLSKKEENGYYYGISNQTLWPLCHIVYTRPRFSREDWEIYRRVNQRFCDAVLEEAGSDPAIVFIQDYHLALLPRMLRTARPDLFLIHFWHIPWPNCEAFRILPWGEELLDGLLGNDILGFHIQYHCNNFMDTVERTIESRVDYEQFRIFRGGRPTHIRSFPISVDFHQIANDSESQRTRKSYDRIVKELGEGVLGTTVYAGVDRIDYTKGIPERVKAFDLMLKLHPEIHGKVTLLQLAAPSRTHIEDYRDINDKLDDLVDEVNWRHQTEEWTPVRFLRGHHDYYTVLASYKIADILLVTSLHDGMNLVAKEYVSARKKNPDGVLLLSQYTGASRDLQDALLVNPYDIEQMADMMYASFCMDNSERAERMSRMIKQVRRNTVYDWGAKIMRELEKILPTGGVR